jgi:hypothetical protein
MTPQNWRIPNKKEDNKKRYKDSKIPKEHIIKAMDIKQVRNHTKDATNLTRWSHHIINK